MLEAALRAGIPIAHACGGKARCSTCRIWLKGPPEDVPPSTGAETRLKDRLGLGAHIRLACQLRPLRPLSFRRLILDESDLVIANQLDRQVPAMAGDVRQVAVMFFDIADFTAISHTLPPYDVMFLLNKFLIQVGQVLAKHGGYFDKAIGDGFMVVFGARGRRAGGLRAVASALEILSAVERARPVMRRLYGIEFRARIGIHSGEALIGALGPPGDERLTVIGDVANIASRVEQANKTAGSSLLITEDLYREVGGDVVSPDFIRVQMPGVEGRCTLYEVTGLTETGEARIEALAREPFSDLPSRTWTRLMSSEDLPEGGLRVVPPPRLHITLTRREGFVRAFNNHCPHMRLPFFGQAIPEGGPLPARQADSSLLEACHIACRFHGTVFNLETGRIVSWCPGLSEDGTSAGFEILGDVSKNEAPLEVFRTREIEGAIWVEF